MGQQLGALSALIGHDVVPAGQEGVESAQPPTELSRGLRDCSIFLAGMNLPVARVLKRKNLDSVSTFIVTENQFENEIFWGPLHFWDKTAQELTSGKEMGDRLNLCILSSERKQQSKQLNRR